LYIIKNKKKKKARGNYIEKLPSEEYGYNSSSILSNVQESRLGQIKMLERGIAPATIVIRESRIWRAKVGGSDSDGAREAPLRVVTAS
jgi:hypothetical protein